MSIVHLLTFGHFQAGAVARRKREFTATIDADAAAEVLAHFGPLPEQRREIPQEYRHAG